MLWGLAMAERVEIEVLAALLVTFTVAKVVPPSLKATEPQLIAGPLAGVTVALKVTELP